MFKETITTTLNKQSQEIIQIKEILNKQAKKQVDILDLIIFLFYSKFTNQARNQTNGFQEKLACTGKREEFKKLEWHPLEDVVERIRRCHSSKGKFLLESNNTHLWSLNNVHNQNVCLWNSLCPEKRIRI